MATKVTPEMIEQINELYVELGVKAQVARKMGISASTVSKYIMSDYVPKNQRIITKCTTNISLPIEIFMGDFGKMGKLCELSYEEWNDIQELRKEVTV